MPPVPEDAPVSELLRGLRDPVAIGTIVWLWAQVRKGLARLDRIEKRLAAHARILRRRGRPPAA